MILFALYMLAGYWGAGVVLYGNKVVICTPGTLFAKKVAYGFLFGWLLFPLALIMKLLGMR